MISRADTQKPSRSAYLTFGAAGLGAVAFAMTQVLVPAQPASAQDWDANAYRGAVEVQDEANRQTISGTVFEDLDRNSVHDAGEPGVAGVTVSNGFEVTTTDAQGRYELPVHDNMTVFVTQPSGYQVPVDENNIAQFWYHHVPEGSPAELDYPAIEPTGSVPAAVNFPLVAVPAAGEPQQRCIVAGDIQTYTEEEVEYARKGQFADLAQRDDYTHCGALFVGDNVGDRPDLFPAVAELAGMINGPARFLPGNHDPNFESTTQEHAFDSYRRYFGPEYYSYQVGDAHFVVLNNVEYPYAGDSLYNGSIDDAQMEWLRQDLAAVPEDKLIVIASHIPLLGYADQSSTQHQTDQIAEIYQLLEGREAYSVAGHVHAVEHMRAGDSLAGWTEHFGIDSLPFTHLTVGAISGDWYNGEMLDTGYPVAIQRDGSYPGVINLDLQGTQVLESFVRTGDPEGKDQMNVGLNTPAYREWFEERVEYNGPYANNKGDGHAFEEPHQVATDEVEGTWLTTNFFIGATGSTVTVSFNGGEAVLAERTQPFNGEDQIRGAEFSDPVAVQQQLVHGGSVADRASHIWRTPLPKDLGVGVHVASVTATDVHGREFTKRYEFQIGTDEEVADAQNTSGGQIPVDADIKNPSEDENGDSSNGGSLVLSVAPGTATLGNVQNAGDRLRLTGELPTVTVTDSRSAEVAANGGWSLSGSSSVLTSEAGELSADSLGWTPRVIASAHDATAGPAVAPGLSGGQGLGAPQVLASATAETRLGSTEVSADLLLEVPMTTAEGTYRGGITVSLFPED